MRKTVITLLMIGILVLLGPSVFWGLGEKYAPQVEPPKAIYSAMNDDNLYLNFIGEIPSNYFVENAEESNLPADQKDLHLITFPEYQNTHILVYGEPHSNKGDHVIDRQERYSGYNIHGENIPNLRWAEDVESRNKYLDDNKWIINPWKDPDVKAYLDKRGENLFHNSLLEPKHQWRKNIWWGLKIIHGKEFRGDEDLAWEEYVHVLQPPTHWGWGWGIAWHDEKDGKGLLYRTIPIAPDRLITNCVPNLYVKAFDPGCPTERDVLGKKGYVAEFTTEYTATVIFGIKEDTVRTNPPYNLPIFIGAVHQVDKGYRNLLINFQSGRGQINGLTEAYPWGGIPGSQFQTVKFDTDKSEVVATFKWKAEPASKALAVGINAWPGFGYLYEGDSGAEFQDNTATVPLTAKQLPDAFVESINPGTTKPVQDKTYKGTVTYSLQKDYPEPLVVQLALNHNRWPVPGIHGKEITLKPGESKTLTFVWHGQKSGQNSTLVAKILPIRPTNKDIDWENNTKTVVLSY